MGDRHCSCAPPPRPAARATTVQLEPPPHQPPPSSSSRAAAAARVIVAASEYVTVEAGRGQKERSPSPPNQTHEREGARGRGACCRRCQGFLAIAVSPLPEFWSPLPFEVATGAAAKPVQRPPLFHFLSSGRVLSVTCRF
ncbi:uncharacterized protein DS421_15g511620 [Arachis hypogaea]|nr:uncharacterized protein DS421_15g511620 [Arachis hypogaea]